MSNLDIIYGVCVDNSDPNNAYRIRMVEIASSLDSVNRPYEDILKIVEVNDAKGKYIPWQYSTGSRTSDPYLAESFMPMHLTMLPEKGQLVKLFKYNGSPTRYEYLGPITNNPIDKWQNYALALQKTKPNSNYEKGLIPNKTKFPLSGKNNEQIIMGENTIVQRLDYITQQKNRREKYPFLQFVQYPSSINVTTESKTETTENDYPVDFVLTTVFDYEPKTQANNLNLSCTIKVYDSSKIINDRGLSGLKKSQVTFTPNFRSLLKTPTITFKLKAGTYNKLINEFTNLLTAIKNKKIYKFPADGTIESYTYTDEFINLDINNQYGFSSNSGGAVPEKPNEIINDSFVVMKDNDQVEFLKLDSATLSKNYGTTDINKYPEFLSLAEFVSNGAYEKFVTKIQAPSTSKTIDSDVSEYINESESANITHVDKILLYSTKNDVSLTTQTPEIDGLSQDKLAQLFKNSGNPDERFKLAHPMLRGDKMLNVIIKLINLLLTHGHEAGKNPPDSLDQNSRTELSNIIQDLQKDLTDNKNSVTLNHYIRLN